MTEQRTLAYMRKLATDANAKSAGDSNEKFARLTLAG